VTVKRRRAHDAQARDGQASFTRCNAGGQFRSINNEGVGEDPQRVQTLGSGRHRGCDRHAVQNQNWRAVDPRDTASDWSPRAASLPDKFHGMADQEVGTANYVDLIMDEAARQRFTAGGQRHLGLHGGQQL
jgi:hypothetical protein